MSTAATGPILPADYNAAQVADFFVHLGSAKMVDEGVPEGITPLKLQKLLYFAQAASLSLFNKKLFSEEIEAWKYGPVVSSIYHVYKENPNSPLTKPQGIFKEIGDAKTQEFLKEVWDMFDKYSASELVQITHNHSPWKDAYQEGRNAVIPAEVLRDYYKDVFVLEEDEQAAV